MPTASAPTLKLLAELVSNAECVLFLGNDQPLGYPATAPPCRDELAAELARELDGGGPVEGNLARLALLYEGARGRNALIRRVTDLLEKRGNQNYQPTPLHQQIAALPFQAVITTAQDKLLEQALLAAGRPHATVMTDVETPYIDEGKVMIYKIHGCVSRPDSLVLTQDDHCLLNRRLGTYLSVLRYLFATKPLLFLNYRLDDLLFRTIFHEVTADVEGHRRRTYAVWSKVSPTWRDIWARHNLALIDQPTPDFLDTLARQISRRERTLAIEATAGPLTKPPYKFLDYYESDDRDIFYGRQVESVRLFRLILSHRLTVLFGASGTGKTSLLKAGVMPPLWKQGYATVYVRALDDPLRAVREEVLALLRRRGRAVEDPIAGTLQDFFRAVLDPEDRLVVFLDQFEEFFLRLGGGLRRRFWAELTPFRDRVLVAGEAVPAEPEVRFVFSLREDFLAPLDEARGHIPELLGDSYRLTNLSDDKASTVITEPAARARLTMTPELVQALLDDLREAGTIAPPQLQIVCDRLYRDCLANPEEVSRGAVPELSREMVTLQDYHRLGGAKGILGGYVGEALDKFPDGNMHEMARSLLKVLVTSRATKAALDRQVLLTELAQAGDLDAVDVLAVEKVGDVLARLVNLRLVREFERGGAALYELAHDHMAAEIHTWIDESEMQAKLARELLRRELESWRSLGKLIEPGALRLIHERREDLKRPSTEELELLFRSALTAGEGVAYWAGRAKTGGVVVGAILQEGLESERPNTRADAVALLGELGLELAQEEVLPWLAEALEDDYPHVRAQAQIALERIGSDQARQILRDNPPQGMIYIPAGPFIMGDDEGQYGDEKPAHEVILQAFYIARYPVTNAEYARFVECARRRPPQHWPEGQVPQGKEKHPVVNVSWYDAREYAAWAGLRLLTEAEWEKVASWEEGDKAGLFGRGKKGCKRKYPWGDAFDEERCNTYESGIGGTTPAEQYSPAGDSPYGCADMAGNVREWTSSLYQDYPYRADDGREDAGASSNRVLRGGSFHEGRRFGRSAARSEALPGDLYGILGFRCGLLPRSFSAPDGA